MTVRACRCTRETGSRYFAPLPDGTEVCFYCHDDFRAAHKKATGEELPVPKPKESTDPRPVRR